MDFDECHLLHGFQRLDRQQGAERHPERIADGGGNSELCADLHRSRRNGTCHRHADRHSSRAYRDYFRRAHLDHRGAKCDSYLVIDERYVVRGERGVERRASDERHLERHAQFEWNR